MGHVSALSAKNIWTVMAVDFITFEYWFGIVDLFSCHILSDENNLCYLYHIHNMWYLPIHENFEQN